jgi:alanine dehydrogenase
MKTLILDAATVRKIIGIKDALGAIEDVFRLLGRGKARMPAKLYLPLPEFDGDFRAMPGWVKGFKGCIIKWVNVHPQNKRKGLPTVMGVNILSDPKTGFPLCVMEATYLTSLRTGAAGGIAAKYLAPVNSKRIALVGCGVQAKTQLEALLEIFDICNVKVWGLTFAEANKFIKEFKKSKRIKMQAVSTVKECVGDADIIVTTTPSRKPIVKLEWIKESVHINAIGADAQGKQELDDRILKKAKIVVDDFKQASHSGEINVPFSRGRLSKKDIYADIGEIVTGKKKAGIGKKEITVFDSTGLAVQDVAVANKVYIKALKIKKRLKYVDFIG